MGVVPEAGERESKRGESVSKKAREQAAKVRKQEREQAGEAKAILGVT